jgi:hypothetical protein
MDAVPWITMDWNGLAKAVSKHAPLLGAVLRFPGSMALGAAIARVFGGNIENVDDLIALISDDPDADFKLEQLEAHERFEIERLAVERIRAGNEDRANARNREIVTQDKLPGKIAITFIAGYFILAFGLLYAIVSDTIDQAEQNVIVEMLKELSLALMLILAYYFGSSNNGNRNNNAS